MNKESVELHVMWHINALLHLFPITIVTTVDGKGKINAAPYSLVIPFCSSPKNPQMLLIANKNWHTAKNIKATGEFVLNYPRADQLKDVTETARLHSKGVNELNHTRYTTTPAKVVRPPRIVECYQHIECRVKDTIRPSKTQLNFIAEVLDISIDEDLCKLSRVEKAKKANPPLYLGMDENMHHVYGSIKNIAPIETDITVG
jgi:flavin reductase (DIM6/NTAB) family NADH-FMN oxidoreductase RutF